MRIKDSARMNMKFEMIWFDQNLASRTAIPFGINQFLRSKVNIQFKAVIQCNKNIYINTLF